MTEEITWLRKQIENNLYHACKDNDVKKAKELLKYAIDKEINYIDPKLKKTPLSWTVYYGMDTITDELIKKGANLFLPSNLLIECFLVEKMKSPIYF